MNFDTLSAVVDWLQAHANKLSSTVRAFCYMLIGLGWSHLTDVQIGLILTFIEVFLGLFTETNTVSKQRVGERINAKVTEIMTGTGSGQA